MFMVRFHYIFSVNKEHGCELLHFMNQSILYLLMMGSEPNFYHILMYSHLQPNYFIILMSAMF